MKTGQGGRSPGGMDAAQTLLGSKPGAFSFRHAAEQTRTCASYRSPLRSQRAAGRDLAPSPPWKVTRVISRHPSLQLSDKLRCAEGISCILKKIAGPCCHDNTVHTATPLLVNAIPGRENLLLRVPLGVLAVVYNGLSDRL